MAKKSEATATFYNLEKALSTNLQSLNDYDLNNFITVIANSIEKDIAAAGYEGEKRRSETIKFLKAIQGYKNIAKEMSGVAASEMNKFMKKYLKKFNGRLKLVNDEDGFPIPEGNEEDKRAFVRIIAPYQAQLIQNIMYSSNRYLNSKIYSLKYEFALFKGTLDEKNKPVRRFFGHISKFCNENAIKTLEKAPTVLENYRKLLYKRLEEMISIDFDDVD